MPVKNVVKIYIENGFYHVYNRGVEKRDIFMEKGDYKVFLHFLKRYLTKPPFDPNKITPIFRTNLFDKIQLNAYCLMPNHFHLMIKQSTKEAMTVFIKALTNSYVHYFNKKCRRRGPLFEGNYKAVLIETEPQLLHLTRYIHLNPKEVQPIDRSNLSTGPTSVRKYSYSSYQEYLGLRKTSWIHPEEILGFFKTAQKTSLQDILSYQSFVEDFKGDSKKTLGSLTLE
ncbi:transposase [Candidatus Microgenomates bacterium]|nr:transposase [Candidatus Microgenomates bacterium]